ncbi:beta strand repeat-containing protein [Nocardioides deserti]|uniref:Big-1 domain-containing protein n=1 Tax=Nocardioides deserti TaxID=1588644 RepID=A0ABR6U7M3_9ACTN|nr:hypothetical protein [Nocardioides deserti]MBC2960434.1 hypothetical protein [Nocardioides deserti]GGO71397.1 hypothetical protein GCM10012276_12270 [Nocardioides deserti]
MNSSGIKRGLAVSAISALAVAGIPALASPASADVNDVINVAFEGPARNGSTGAGNGAIIVLETKGITELEAQNLTVVDNDLEGSANDATQTIGAVTVLDYREDDGTPAPAETNEFGNNDGFDEIVIQVPVTTTDVGDTAEFAVYLEEGGTAGVDATEPRAQLSIQTGGVPTTAEISPNSQTTAAGQQSAPYTVTLRDAGGRLTQLTGAENLDVTDSAPAAGTVTVTNDEITAGEILRGTTTFRATGNTEGAYTITVAGDTDTDGAGGDVADGPANLSSSAQLIVAKAVGTLTDDEVDIVTAADGWTGFGGGDYGVNSQDVPVRVDQTSIRIDIRSNTPAADANGTIVLTVASPNVTFGGQGSTTVSTTLDANGRGSLTITPDAGTVQEGDVVNIDGGGLDLQLDFQRGTVSEVNAEAETYVSKIDGTVDITVVTTDQFGLPAAGAFVEAQRTGANTDAQPQARKATDANGRATFTFTDVNATNGSTDTVTFRAFRDQFAANPIDPDGDSNFAEHFDTATIRYTTDGQGSDFNLSLDNVNTGSPTYDPTTVSVVPFSDTNTSNTPANGVNDDEVVELAIAGGDNGAPATVTVDNGALILRNGETRLSEGAASERIVLPESNAPQSIRIVGTKSGLTTVTVTSGGRTKTAQFTVTAQTDPTQARNVTVSAQDDEVAQGEQQATFIAVVTDAFGNPLRGYPVGALNIQVSGPGAFQDSDATTNPAGEARINVRLDDDAEGPVTIRVQGLNPGGNTNQFGAAENQLDPTAAAGSAQGLSASSNVTEATVNVIPGEGPDTPPATIVATATGSNRASDGYDRIRVSVDKPEAAADAAVELYKVNAQGKVRRVKTKSLNSNGRATFVRKDLNGKKSSKYFAKVRPTDTSKGDRTKAVFIK